MEIQPQKLPWHALYVNFKSEKKVCQELVKYDIETFLPLFTKIRYYRNSKRKSEVPLISCYVFARVPPKLRGLVCSIGGVVKFVKTDNKPSVIPVDEINILKKISGIRGSMEISNERYFEVGEKVHVHYGPLAGIVGEVIEKRGQNRFLIKIHSLNQAISIEIDNDLLVPDKLCTSGKCYSM